ncbi:MAG: FG-GAP-like repeat-containing protein [Sedimentisphaeraceae bacterium JB056]
MNRIINILILIMVAVCAVRADFDNNNLCDIFAAVNSDSFTLLQRYESSGCLSEVLLKNSESLGDISVIACGDIDNDSFAEIIVGFSGSSTCSWYEYSIDTQSIVSGGSFDLIDEPADISIGNFDGDSDKDIIVVTASSACFWYEYQTGSVVMRSNLKKGAKAAAMGDLNENGISDILITYSTGLFLVESTGDNSWAALPGCSWSWGATTSNIKSIISGDIDGDGKTVDFAYIYPKDSTDTGELIWRSLSVTEVGSDIYWRATFAEYKDFESIRMADVDGDDINEIVAVRSNGEVVFISAVEGGKLKEKAFSHNMANVKGGHSIAVCGDSSISGMEPQGGRKDFVVVGGQHLAGWFQSGSQAGECDYLGRIASNVSVATLGDFDNDDKLDLFTGKIGEEGTWYELSGVFQKFMPVLSIGSGTVPNGLAVGDFDGDGKGDLFNCVSWGNCYWYRQAGDNSKETVKTITNDGAIACCLGDIDNDSYGDLLISTASGLRWYEATGEAGEQIYRMTIPDLTNARAMAIGEIDGDMYKDIFVVKDNGEVAWLEASFDNQCPQIVSESLASNAASVAVGDFDGNSGNELLVAVENEPLKWYRSLANNQITEVSAEAFGLDAESLAVNNSSLDFSFECDPMSSDLDFDCYVDFDDLELFSQRWLETYQELGLYDLSFFGDIASNWYDCNDPQNIECVLKEKKQAFIHMDYADEVYWASNLGYSTYREAEIAEFFRRCSLKGIDGVFWRVTAGGKVLHWSDVCSVFPERISPEFLSDQDLELADIMSEIDPLALAVQYAHLNGVKLYVWLRVSDEAGTDTDNPYARATDIILDHPEYALLDKQGNPMIGTVCYNEVAVREAKLAHISELVSNYDLDGVLLCTRTHAFYHNEDSGYQYGYNPPVVAEYYKRYGVDILTEEFDYDKWLEIRAGGMSDFVQEASNIVHNAGMKLWFGIKSASNEKRGWPYGEAIQPWKSWLANDLIDGVVAGHYYTPAEMIENQTLSFQQAADPDQTIIFLIQLYDFDTSFTTPLSDIETLIQTISTSGSTGGSFYEALQLEDNMDSYWEPIYQNVDRYWHLNFNK